MSIPERSDSVVELVTALNKFQAVIQSVPKTSSNPYFHSKYADLDAIWEMCRKPLTENGLALIQTTAIIDGRTYLETTLYHTSGQYLTGRYPITPMKQVKDTGWIPSEDPQSIGSALTYARRYAMSALLGISADEDDDAEKGMGRGPRRESSKLAQGEAPAPVAVVSGVVVAQTPGTVPSSVGELLTRATMTPARGGLGYKNRTEVFAKLGIESAIEIASLEDAWAKLQP